MSSQAFRLLERRLDEARLLGSLDPVRSGDTTNVDLTNAVNRGTLILACAHLEGFLEDLAVEVLDLLASSSVPVEQLPVLLRALPAEAHLRDLEPIRDRQRRAPRIQRLFEAEKGMWTSGFALTNTMIDSTLLTGEMSNPGSKEIQQFLQFLGVEDVFTYLDSVGMGHLRRHTNELVGKRNAVAHGEVAATATAADVDRYIKTVEDLAREIDALVARATQSICQSTATPWAI